MEAVHILVRTDALEQLRGIEVLWQRQLHKDAVDGGVVVELIDQRKKIFLASIARQVMGHGIEAHLRALLALVRHVNLGGWVAAHQNYGEAGSEIGSASWRERGCQYV